MNKIVSVLISLMMVGAFYSTSFATCNGPGCGSYSGTGGEYDVSVDSFGTGTSADGKILPRWSGAAGGIGGATGFSAAEADGFVFDGTVDGNVSTIGGGFSETDAYRFNPGIGDVGIGVGSWTQTSAVTGAHVDISVNPDSDWGGADGSISGFTTMGSLNGSVVGASPLRGWKTDGYSAGVAGQGAVGGFEGGAFAISGADYYSSGWMGWYGHDVDSNANASVDAQIDMNGFSVSESYRFIDNNNGFHTEGMGTYVEAGTDVTSYGYTDSYDNGLAEAGSGVCGSYVATGGTGTQTVQSNDNGRASATAVGAYVGTGALNTAFHGSAAGYSNTSMTTHPTANGVISRASAGMSVTSSISNSHYNE